MLAHLDDGTIVAARQERMLVSSFHPELTDDLRFHRYFLDMAASKDRKGHRLLNNVITDDLNALLDVLPPHIRQFLMRAGRHQPN